MNSIELQNVNSEEKYHEVTDDESLRSIAVNIGTMTVSQLAKYNNLSCDATLYKGQKIFIPSELDLKRNVVRKRQLTSHGSSTYRSISSVITDFDENYPMPLTVNQDIADDVFEKKFMKIPSRYVNFQSGWFIDGILLLTEEFFCFDSTSEFNSLTHQKISMKEFEYPFNIKFPIDSVISFNTHISLAKLIAKNSKNLPESNGLQMIEEFESKEDEQPSQKEHIYVGLQTNETLDVVTLTPDGDWTDLQFDIDISRNVLAFKIDLSELNNLCSIMLKAKSLGKDREELEPDLTEITYDQRPPECCLVDGSSDILTQAMLDDLARNFPVHWFGHSLKALYTSEGDGYSLATMYRKSKDCENAVVLVIKDTGGKIFGSIMNETMKISSYFYGTGETSVFEWSPKFEMYSWSKKNNFFMRGSPDYFMIGSDNGLNAIWFDQSLKNGRSDATSTFNNPSLCTINEEKTSSFVIDKIELWELVI